MKEVKFPTFEEAIYLHHLLIEKFGGTQGILDAGLLESALARPRSGYYHSLSEQSAALLHSLIKNHAFVDGNKRMAFGLTATFLLVNGYSLEVGPEEAQIFIEELAASSKIELGTIIRWLENYMQAVAI